LARIGWTERRTVARKSRANRLQVHHDAAQREIWMDGAIYDAL
jgi:dihydrodipicolinate reductase